MAKKGFASQLPPDLREELDRRIVAGNLSVDDLWAFLRGRGVEVGRSSVHRHIQSVEETSAHMREAREAAQAIVAQLGPDAAEGKIGQLLIEVTQNIAFKIAREKLVNPEGPGLSMEDLMFLTSSVQKLVSAQKTDQDRIAKIRAEALKTAASKAEVAMKSRGMSADTIAAIRSAVLGADG